MRQLQMGFMAEGASTGDTFCGKFVAYDKATLEHLGVLEYTLVSGEPHLDHIEVNPAYRRRGVGRALVTALVSNLSLPYNLVHWAVRPDGHAFKKRMDIEFSGGIQDA